MFSVRSLVAALCLALVAAPAVAVSALSQGTPVIGQYQTPNQGVVSLTGQDTVPTNIELGTIPYNIKVTNNMIQISNEGDSAQKTVNFAQANFNGFAVFTLPGDEQFETATYQSSVKIYKTGQNPNGNQNKIGQAQISVVGNTVYVNFSGFTMEHAGRINIKYTTKPKTVVPSSTAAPVVPSSTGREEPEESSTGRPTPSTGGNEGGANGDPQITGFMGQSFQVHGTANTDYSVISSAALQYNAHFVFLSEGKCRAGTECFAHPGNYFGGVGILVKQEDGSVAKIEVTAGSVDAGMKVTIDGEPLTPSEKHLTIDSVNSLHFGTPYELLLQTRDYTLRLQNSDMFLNQQVSIRTPLLEQIKAFNAGDKSALASLPHGILGQTWRRMSYPNRWVHLEGDLMNYIVAGGVLAKPQEFNRFMVAA